MKVSRLLVLFLMVGTTLLFLNFSSSRTGSSSSINSDMVFSHHGDDITVTTTGRGLKENGYNPGTDHQKGHAGKVNLDDYHPIDPVPSSKASIKPGPIQHGTPLIPYIPRPSPPNHP